MTKVNEVCYYIIKLDHVKLHTVRGNTRKQITYRFLVTVRKEIKKTHITKFDENGQNKTGDTKRGRLDQMLRKIVHLLRNKLWTQSIGWIGMI